MYISITYDESERARSRDNAKIATPASKNRLKNIPIAQYPRHKKITIRELAYSARFVVVGEDAVSSASKTDFLIRCLLRFPSLMVSASNAPVAIQRRTV
jgi:hypothetical protein